MGSGPRKRRTVIPKSSGVDFDFNATSGLGANTLFAAQLASQQESTIGSTAADVMGQIKEAFPEGVPPGSSLNVGGKNTTANIPLNRELTGDEIAAVAADRFFVPRADDIKNLTNQGVWNAKWSKGIPLVENLERTYRQYAAGKPHPLLTFFDKNLQKVQGKISSIRRYVFGEGGKQLTPYEAGIVNALIIPTGKSDEQYNTDLDEAIGLIQQKASLALGGQQTPDINALSQDSNDSISDDDLIQSILSEI